MTAALALILTKAFQLFLVLDPIGNTGIIATLIAKFSKERQRVILLREILFSLIILIAFFFGGSYLLSALDISQAAITMTGGIVFMLFSITLLFPGTGVDIKNLEEEPFLVPIAMPLVVGPSSMATVILLAHDKSPIYLSLAAIFLAWLATGTIIFFGPFLLNKLGRIGMQVIERLVGMICAMVAVNMLLRGAKLFLANLS
jgi:multiple antibiotic resistance protein